MEDHFFEVSGHQNRTILCEQIIPASASQDVVLILPGAGYTADRPLLYFTTDLLLKNRKQVFIAHTNYNRYPHFHALTKQNELDQRNSIVAEEAQLLAEFMTAKKLRPQMIVGKSIGTRAMETLVPHFETRHNIWFTPVLTHWDYLGTRSASDCIVIGTADEPYYSLAKNYLSPESIVIPDADHSLEFQDDMQKSIKTLGVIMHRVEEYIQRSN